MKVESPAYLQKQDRMQEVLSRVFKEWAYTIAGDNLVFVHHKSNIYYAKRALQDAGILGVDVEYVR